MRIASLLLFCAVLLFSCASDPVNVMVDKTFSSDSLPAGKSTIIFDGKDTFNIADSAFTVKLVPGKHSFILDKAAPKEFTVGSKGGILNLADKEYIAFEIEYAAPASSGGNNFSLKNIGKLSAVVLMDSFVIIPKHSMGHRTDSSLRAILPKLQQTKNGNYLGFNGQSMDDYDSNETIAGIKKFGKGKLFINKFWDYDPNQEVPESVEIMTRKNSFGSETATKSAVYAAKVFLLYAKISEEEYTVKSLSDIRNGSNDAIQKNEKEKLQKEKEKKQLKF